MRKLLPPVLVAILATSVVAQEGPAIGILKGEVVKWDPAGRFSFSGRDRKLRECTFDDQTYLSKDGARVTPAEIAVGAFVEVVADQSGELGQCRALTVYIVPGRGAAAFAEYRKALARQRYVLDNILPRGRITLSGVVLEIGETHLLLKTRAGERKRIQLRDDTRYTWDGRPSDPAMLEINAKVFVRAGEGFGGELEAYQVVRGQIFMPH